MTFEVGDQVSIRHAPSIVGTIRSINVKGNLGVDWEDGVVTEDGMIHPDDVDPKSKE